MAASHILAVFSAIFLCVAVVRILRERGQMGSAVRTWLIVGLIFAAVSVWLWIAS